MAPKSGEAAGAEAGADGMLHDLENVNNIL